jgi:EmrB/QacA subfamily drug resistance transporter
VNEQLHFTHRQILIVYSGLMLGMLLAALDQTVVGTAMPTIAGKLHGLNHYTWVTISYVLASTVSLPLFGKLGDMYGRKQFFQLSIALFLVGSALCGLSQTYLELNLFRALQGLGSGGLMVGSMAIIGDIVPPRERGRYQGYIGSVFAVSTIAGPLVGGFIIDNFSWRWIFYVNLPVGIVALFVVGAVLHLPKHRIPHQIDILGFFLLALGASALTLALMLGGTDYPWGSSLIVGLLVAGAVLIVLFVLQERTAAEPMIPLYLFRNGIFNASSGAGFIVGLAMFGSMIYLPMYLQFVDGVSATSSGLRLLPFMVTMLSMSIFAGRTISRRGRYKIFPILGMVAVTIGIYLLSTLDAGSSYTRLALFIAILGVGMGMTMQVLVLAVQNAVDYRDLGVATSSSTFFRSMGSVFGLSIFGAIFSHQFNYLLPRTLTRRELMDLGSRHLSIQQLTPKVMKTLIGRVHLIDVFAQSIHTVFIWGVPFAVLGLVITLFLREIPLRERSHLAHRRAEEGADEGETASLEVDLAPLRPSASSSHAFAPRTRPQNAPGESADRR